MKHLSILFLILLSVALCFNSAQAQTAPNVCQAQLFFAEINMQGKIITSGNALVFVDEQPRGFLGPRPVRNSEAFSIDKSNISEIIPNQQSSTLSIYTKRPVKYQSKEEKHITFKFINGNCNEIATWLRVKPLGPPTIRPGSNPCITGRPPLIIQAKQRRSMRPDISGILTISDNLITFGNRGEGRYQWGPRDLRDIQQKGACVLRITPFVGSEATFNLQDRCIGLPEFRRIRGCFLR